MSDRDFCDFRWVQQEMERWAFMPSWEISVAPHAGWEASSGQYSTRFRFIMSVPNSYPPHEMTQVVGDQILPFMTPRSYFGDWLRRACRELLLHEADEWLKRDGVAPFDPHRS